MGFVQEFRRFEVRIPMMPKGVEHLERSASTARATEVRIPMMPKGVEHSLGVIVSYCSDVQVRIPMMPKGVEHSLGNEEKNNSGECEFR